MPHATAPLSLALGASVKGNNKDVLMTYYEMLSVGVACIAALISLSVWNEQRKLQKESNELQKATSELAKKQLEILVKEDDAKSSARLKLDLISSGRSHKFVVTNIGSVDALNVNFQLLLSPNDSSPLIASDINEKLPAPKLPPGSSISLIAAIHDETPLAYNAKLMWTNPDGKVMNDSTYVCL
jgi:hypothetical protein